MQRLASIAGVVILGLAACGGPTHVQPTTTGCPAAAAVAMAQWNPKAVGSPAYRGTPKDATWLVRLGHRDADADGKPAAGTPPPGPVQGWEIAKLGLGPLPEPVWLLRPGVAPCEARVVGYVAERVDDGLVSFRISAVLAGCPAPAEEDRDQAAWISFAGGEPKGCTLRTPARIGERAGLETAAGDFVVAPLTEPTTLPAAWALAAPEEPCEAGCERLWSLDAIDAEPAILQVLVTDLMADDGSGGGACARAHRDRFGLYAVPEDAAPVALAIGVERAAELVGALVDERGTRVVLTAGIDDWAAHDVGAEGAIGNGRIVPYFIAHEEDNLWLSMAPYCGP